MIFEVRAIVEVSEDEFDEVIFGLFLDALLRKENIVAESIDARKIDALDV